MSEATLTLNIDIYGYFRITYDTFWVVFIAKSIFRIFEIVFNLFYIRISAISKIIYSIARRCVYSTQSKLSAILCEPCSEKSTFFLLWQNFWAFTRGHLGCLLGFWPSGPKPCRKKWFLYYHLPCSLKTFKNVFAFLYVQVKVNYKEICEEISFPFFSEKWWCQHFCSDPRLIISKKCVATPIFFVDSNSPCKDLLFPHGPNLVQKPLYLVGTVLEAYWKPVHEKFILINIALAYFETFFVIQLISPPDISPSDYKPIKNTLQKSISPRLISRSLQ